MKTKESRVPTLAQVARAARVSLKTASRVLNESANVRPEKVIKVRAAMKRLGYRPNELARSLMTRKSSAIGMIVANLSNPFVVHVIKEVQAMARSLGYVVVVTSSGGLPDVERSEVESLVRRRIDGLIIAPAESRRDTLSGIVPDDLPLVTLDQLIRGASFDSVVITNRLCAREATRHMMSHNFSRIVAVGTRPHLYTIKERLAGYRDGMREGSLQPRECLVKHESLLTAQWFEQEVLHEHTPDAIFTLNWISTLNVLRCMQVLGIAVGRSMPLICFDDFELGDLLSPRLSVVKQPSEMLGRESARLLFERLNGTGEQPSRAVVLPARLMIRESCGCR